MDLVECSTCGRMFRDTDNTRVCPLGHENPWVDEDHDDWLDYLGKEAS